MLLWKYFLHHHQTLPVLLSFTFFFIFIFFHVLWFEPKASGMRRKCSPTIIQLQSFSVLTYTQGLISYSSPFLSAREHFLHHPGSHVSHFSLENTLDLQSHVTLGGRERSHYFSLLWQPRNFRQTKGDMTDGHYIGYWTAWFLLPTLLVSENVISFEWPSVSFVKCILYVL